MAYIRAKKLRSDKYLYLVRSVWDPKKGTSRQEIIRYLGKASEATRDDLPAEYRDDPKVLAALAAHSPLDTGKRDDAAERSRQALYKGLTDGDLRSCVRVYGGYVGAFGSDNFFDRILKPVMYRIGEDWASKRISIATEHIASNVAQRLVRTIMDGVAGTGKKLKVLLCVPLGEEHRLGCDVLETYLSAKGFRVYNMGTSVPTDSILGFIADNGPDIALVSITLPDNLAAGQRLVRRIRAKYDLPVLVGGYAVQAGAAPKFEGTVIGDVELDEVPKILRKAV